ncbi:unnamed protein product [Protopolystoma xenopodis]|uniref:Uncharacterized protein n=1 Tax=Protopolystoma xenopodis TaxID=117903 RepID=A0A448X013_9PLAT|nr:unnamed protein product [Protopolystoma xenopodis]
MHFTKFDPPEVDEQFLHWELDTAELEFITHDSASLRRHADLLVKGGSFESQQPMQTRNQQSTLGNNCDNDANDSHASNSDSDQEAAVTAGGQQRSQDWLKWYIWARRQTRLASDVLGPDYETASGHRQTYLSISCNNGAVQVTSRPSVFRASQSLSGSGMRARFGTVSGEFRAGGRESAARRGSTGGVRRGLARQERLAASSTRGIGIPRSHLVHSGGESVLSPGFSEANNSNGCLCPLTVNFEVLHAPSHLPFHRLPPAYLTNLHGVAYASSRQSLQPGRRHLNRLLDFLPSVTLDNSGFSFSNLGSY